MFLKNPRDRERNERGQALALGAGSMLILALMLMFSFNVSQAIHEKIRLQNYSDAKAYSMAVVEARAFNYIAYTNRAMAAAYVSALSLHAYMSAISSIPDMCNAAAINFLIMAGMEFAMCCACTYCSCVQHCIEGIEDIGIAFDYFDEKDDKADDVKDLESHFNRAIMGMEIMMTATYYSQYVTLLSTANVLRGAELDALKGSAGAENSTADQVAPHASDLPMGVAALNIREFACAIEAPALLNMLAFGCPSVSQENQAKVMTEVANATRPEWPADRPFFPLFISPMWLFDTFMTDIPDDGMSIPVFHSGTAKLIDSTNTGQLTDGKQGREGTTMGARDKGMVISFKDHAGMIFPYDSSIFSDKDGGKHTPGGAHDDEHDEFAGVNADTGFGCIWRKNCFIKYRADSDKSDDWGQPSVYSYTEQDLSLRGNASSEKPWEINDSGEVTLTHGDQGQETVTLKPGTGMAMSKALVYYHRFGDWSEQPNLFNPYWRAKLHPFGRLDAALVLAAAGQASWAGVAGIGQVPLN